MKKLLALILALVMLVSLTACESKKEKQEKYDTANRYMRQGKYEEAIVLLNDLDGFLDSDSVSVYCEALSYCEIGDYESAYEMLLEIPEYPKTPTLLCQIYHETRLFEGINDLALSYKNPDSLKVVEVEGYYYTNPETDLEKSRSITQPAFVIEASGQNGYGGYSMSYVVLTQASGADVYEYLGSCNSLDYDDYDASDDDDFYEMLVAAVINSIYDYVDEGEMKEIGSDYIDFNRVENIISSKNYRQIKRIDDLTYDLFGNSIGDIVFNSGI